MRKLARIERILSLNAIDGADNIEVATIQAWKVVVRKGEFKENDLCIYFEIDSFLPIKPEYEFLRKSCYKNHDDLGEGFRLRTIKLRGQISQGLALPINDLVQGKIEGEEVTELLGVKKYELQMKASRGKSNIINYFPSFIPKTDEERIQNLFKEYETFKHKTSWIYTEKLEGTSMTIFMDEENKIRICSRNYELSDSPNCIYWEQFHQNKTPFPKKGYAFQGEIIGPGIQNNYYNLEERQFYVFSIYNFKEGKYLPLKTDDGIHGKVNDILCGGKIVPTTLAPPFHYPPSLPESIQELLERSEIKSAINGDVEQEGTVISNPDRSIHFKVINNNFLLKEQQ